MQFLAAKSLWRKCRLLKYSIPRAMSTMNFTSVCRGTNWEGKVKVRQCKLFGNDVWFNLEDFPI